MKIKPGLILAFVLIFLLLNGKSFDTQKGTEKRVLVLGQETAGDAKGTGTNVQGPETAGGLVAMFNNVKDSVNASFGSLIDTFRSTWSRVYCAVLSCR